MKIERTKSTTKNNIFNILSKNVLDSDPVRYMNDSDLFSSHSVSRVEYLFYVYSLGVESHRVRCL